METRYLTIDAKRLTVYSRETAEQASGGGTVFFAALPRTKRPVHPGAVVCLQDYRRGLAGQPEELAREEDGPVCRERGAEVRRGLLPDLVSAAAVVCMAVLVTIKCLLL